LVGACGARGINGALCLIHFLVGRLRASNKENRGKRPRTCGRPRRLGGPNPCFLILAGMRRSLAEHRS
jgi:hypothetical protein